MHGERSALFSFWEQALFFFEVQRIVGSDKSGVIAF